MVTISNPSNAANVLDADLYASDQQSMDHENIAATGGSITKTVSASKYLSLDPTEFAGAQFLKIVSGASEAATRTLELVTRPV